MKTEEQADFAKKRFFEELRALIVLAGGSEQSNEDLAKQKLVDIWLNCHRNGINLSANMTTKHPAYKKLEKVNE